MAVVIAQTYEDEVLMKLGLPETGQDGKMDKLDAHIKAHDRAVTLRLVREGRIAERLENIIAPPIPADCLPNEMTFRAKSEPPDFREFTRNNIFIVSEKLKACVDTVGDSNQTFHPLTMHSKKNGATFQYYFWVISTVLDAIETNGPWGDGVKPVGIGMEGLQTAPGPGRGSRERCAVKSAAIEGHAAWFDRRFTSPFISDRVWRCVVVKGLSGMAPRSEWSEV